MQRFVLRSVTFRNCSINKALRRNRKCLCAIMELAFSYTDKEIGRKEIGKRRGTGEEKNLVKNFVKEQKLEKKGISSTLTRPEYNLTVFVFSSLRFFSSRQFAECK